ncbi:hypothetical protein PWT90_06154 [Aphanocladium album]|nr:hypothetical protein PWT90_06154 [Aphanocladium album]
MAKVETAVAADAPALGAMQLNAFDDAFFDDMFFEPYTVAAWAGFIERAGRRTSGGPRVGVIRDEDGNVKAGCLLHIAPDEDAVAELYGPWQDAWGTALPYMNKDKMDAFFADLKTQHKSTMGSVPHISRGRGYGLALLEYVSKIADELQLPLYLNSDEGVTDLYKRVGYVQQPDEVRTSTVMVPMMRAAVKP